MLLEMPTDVQQSVAKDAGNRAHYSSCHTDRCSDMKGEATGNAEVSCWTKADQYICALCICICQCWQFCDDKYLVISYYLDQIIKLMLIFSLIYKNIVILSAK